MFLVLFGLYLPQEEVGRRWKVFKVAVDDIHNNDDDYAADDDCYGDDNAAEQDCYDDCSEKQDDDNGNDGYNKVLA